MANRRFAQDNQIRDIQLHRREIYRLDKCRPGTEIICTGGTLWVTQSGDLKDHILGQGQKFVINHPDTVLIEAIPEATLHIQPPMASKEEIPQVSPSRRPPMPNLR